jgi:site-specific DNA-cytosine methylase
MGFAGGFTLGMVQAGFDLVAKRELTGGFGVANCEANRHLLGEDWKTQIGDASDWEPVPSDVVFGNPPCSGFSLLSSKHFRGATSPINHCMWSFVEYAARVEPAIAVFESVTAARTRPDGYDLMQQLHHRLETRTRRPWNLYHVRHNALSLGGAGMRRRYFWLASRVPFGVDVDLTQRVPTLNDVIGDLVPLHDTWERQPYRAQPSWWAASRVSPSGAVDGHIGIRTPLDRRVRDLANQTPWYPGEALAVVTRRHYEQHGCLPDSWAPYEQKFVESDFAMGFTTPIRWTGTNPARVITGGSMHTGVHPQLNRTFYHRECARIMGFPDDWRLWPLRAKSNGVAATHGKGITVDCGRWIGSWIRASLNGAPGPMTGDRIGEREWDIDVSNSYKKFGMISSTSQ